MTPIGQVAHCSVTIVCQSNNAIQQDRLRDCVLLHSAVKRINSCGCSDGRRSVQWPKTAPQPSAPSPRLATRRYSRKQMFCPKPRQCGTHACNLLASCMESQEYKSSQRNIARALFASSARAERSFQRAIHLCKLGMNTLSVALSSSRTSTTLSALPSLSRFPGSTPSLLSTVNLGSPIRSRGDNNLSPSLSVP